MTPLDFFQDLANPQLSFLPRALAMAVLSAIVCAVVGCFVVLRGMAFIGDAVSHAVFPGVALAFLLGGNILLGGAVAGIITALIITLLGQSRLLKEDSAIGIVFVAAFALGLLIISRAPGYAGSLESFLFGSIAGISPEEVPWNLLAVALIVGVTLLFARSFATVALDRESARALGLPVLFLDVVLNVLVTLAIVVSLHIVGNILVVALLVAPAATARLLTNSLGRMLVLAPLLGALASVAGLWASWTWDLPVGACIVLAAALIFALVRISTARPASFVWRLPVAGHRVAAAGVVVLLTAGIAGGGWTVLAPGASAVPAAMPQRLAAETSSESVTQPSRQVIRNIHVDASHLHWDEAKGLRMDTIVGTNTLTPADDIILDLQQQEHEGRDVSKLTVPAPTSGRDLTFLGKPGTVLWNAPQGLYGNWKPVWAGVGAGSIPADKADLGSLWINLVKVEGPSWVEVFQTGGTSVNRAFSSRDSTFSRMKVEEHAHGHYNWTFGAPGDYVMHFQATAKDPTTGKEMRSNISKVHWRVGAPSAEKRPLGVGPESPRFRKDSTSPSTPPSTPPSGPTTPVQPSPSASPNPSQPAPKPSQPKPSAPKPPATQCTRPVLSRGHVDLAATGGANGLSTVLVDETAGAAVQRRPESVVLAVNDSLLTTVPPGFGAVGRPGDRLWIVPQVQRAQGLWAGFNTERVDYSGLKGGVNISLVGLKGPSGGYVSLFDEDLITGLRVRWDSRKSPAGALPMPWPSHVHQNIAFSRKGLYTLTIRYSATTKAGASVHTDAVYTFAVGTGVPCGAATGGPSTGGPAPNGPTGGGPQGNAPAWPGGGFGSESGLPQLGSAGSGTLSDAGAAGGGAPALGSGSGGADLAGGVPAPDAGVSGGSGTDPGAVEASAADPAAGPNAAGAADTSAAPGGAEPFTGTPAEAAPAGAVRLSAEQWVLLVTGCLFAGAAGVWAWPMIRDLRRRS